MEKISLDANVIKIPVGNGTHETSEEELNKHIDELFDKYICAGMGIKPEDELYAKLRVIRKIFNNGYRCGYNDMLSRVTGEEWEHPDAALGPHSARRSGRGSCE